MPDNNLNFFYKYTFPKSNNPQYNGAVLDKKNKKSKVDPYAIASGGIKVLDSFLNRGATNKYADAIDTVGSLFPGIGGVIAKGAAFIGRGFTDSVNEEYQRNKLQEIAGIANTQSNATDALGLDAERRSWQNVDLGSLDDWGQIGFLSSGSNVKKARNAALNMLTAAYDTRQENLTNQAFNINARNTITNLLNTTAYGGLLDIVDPVSAIGLLIYTDNYVTRNNKQNNYKINNILAGVPNNGFALGGVLQAYGGTWGNTTHVDAGGTHEDNPYQGVQMGVDSLGTPNLVELNELIWNDYVFSNRLTVPTDRRNKYAKGGKMNKKDSNNQISYEDKLLKPYAGLTFADAAKKAERLTGVDERPNDPIAQRGLEEILNVLMETQEKERALEQLEEMENAIENMTPEEYAMLLQEMLSMQEQAAQLEALQQLQQMIPQGMELMQLIPEGQLPMYALGGLLDKWNMEPNILALGGSTNRTEDLDNLTNSLEVSDDSGSSTLTSTVTTTATPDLEKTMLNLYITSKPHSNIASRNPSDFNSLSENAKLKVIDFYITKGLNDAEKRLRRAEVSNYVAGEVVKDYRKKQSESSITKEKLKDLSDDELNHIATSLGINDNSLDAERQSIADYDSAKDNLIDSIVNKSKEKGSNISNIGQLSEVLNTYNNPHIKWTPYSKEDLPNYGLNYTDYNWNTPERLEGERVPDNPEDPNSNSHIEYTTPSGVKWSSVDGDYRTSDAYLRPLWALLNANLEDKKAFIDSILPLNEDRGITEYKDRLKLYVNNPEFFGSEDYINNYEDFKKHVIQELSTEDSRLLTKNPFFRSLPEELKEDALYRVEKELLSRFYAPKPLTLYEILGNEGILYDKATVGDNLSKYNESESIPIEGSTAMKVVLTPKNNRDNYFPELQGLPEGIELGKDGNYYFTAPKQEVSMPEVPGKEVYNTAKLINAGNILHNLITPTDTTNVEALRSIGNKLRASTPSIGASFAGLQMSYDPSSNTLFYDLMGNINRAADAIVNNASGNIGAIAAGLTNNAYMGNLALGKTYEDWKNTNRAALKDALTLGLTRDSSNYDRALKAAAANQEALLKNENAAAGFDAKAAMLQQSIDDARANAINAGIQNIVNLGLQSTQLDYLNKLHRWQVATNPYVVTGATNNPTTNGKGGKLRYRRNKLSF